MEITVRKAALEDAASIYDIIQEAFTKYQKDLNADAKVAALYETVEDIKRDIECKCVLIAFLGNIPIGTIRYEIKADGTAYLSRFGVRPAYQKYGAGTALMRALEQDAEKNGATAIVLHTALKMKHLIDFYQRMGYYVASTSDDTGYIRALLRKPLQQQAEAISPS
ncbi:GNAT family N-acetyltransferase [Mahella sp.]|uniref:GNAT family N-acetyltransferase n=1 Tax=Mahella sp. TaxID=2798721 RepID=UPI0025BE80A4|nr:GNAT family N-acetyltransferase [Mahella sp.]MBZ4665898.1 GCN5-related N-acetyltransferase [Mahella sp.]